VPNLHYALGDYKTGTSLRCCGPIPRVDIIHLHHGVWLSNGQAGQGEMSGGGAVDYPIGLYPFMATGEEKTAYILPKGFGYPIAAKDFWVFNYMLHNLTPSPAYVYVTYTMDFIPMTSPLAKTITPVHPIWMDVEARHIYPVFNVYRGSGKNGQFTFPYMAKDPYPGLSTPLNQFTVDHPGVLVATAGHVHPGGLYTELDSTRTGVTPHGKGVEKGLIPGSVRLFRSTAHYWDPRGPISWDMAMQGTASDWRPQVQTGDVLSVSATYETKRASWYESMGIMVVWEAWTGQGRGVNPFAHAVDQKGYLTHGHLAENDNHGGSVFIGVNLKSLKDCPAQQVTIKNFTYDPGGFSSNNGHPCIPTVTAGQALTFINQDASSLSQFGGLGMGNSFYINSIFHTVTSCQNPCGLDTGISYPLAQGSTTFDSAQLGIGTPASGSLTWSTPKNLKPGIYTYFCRIHPFMRGVFRVVG
jgi:plastocyanin